MLAQPKKSFSQNFLEDESIVERIVSDGNAESFDWILEIGAGEGALTAALAQESRHVIATELDRDLIPGLLRRFPLASNVSICEGDIVRMDIPEVLRKYGWNGESYAIFGNIPYAITGKIIRTLLAIEPAPARIVLMVQKEVAERVVAKDGKQSILSIAVALFGKASILFNVSRSAFRPVPNVDSAILCMVPHSDRLPIETREHILRLVKVGFASRRKTLANNLATLPEYSKEDIECLLESPGLSGNVRAEELSVGEWRNLCEQMGRLLLTKTKK